jgi:hypothetical protein
MNKATPSYTILYATAFFLVVGLIVGAIAFVTGGEITAVDVFVLLLVFGLSIPLLLCQFCVLMLSALQPLIELHALLTREQHNQLFAGALQRMQSAIVQARGSLALTRAGSAFVRTIDPTQGGDHANLETQNSGNGNTADA